jgi:hypothetical protein
MPLPPSRLRKYTLVALFLLPVSLWLAWFYFAYRPIHRLAGPRLVYWAWERPEDLRLLNPKTEGVAFLDSSVEILADTVRIFPRMQPLYVLPGTQVVAVVRVYSHAEQPPVFNEAQFSPTLEDLLDATRKPGVVALQIDYDARVSERAFYSRLVAGLRQRLGPAYPISITALASWCIGDRWIQNLPVNEAVPMIFSMGPDEALIRQYLSSVGTFPEPLCRGSLGISTGEWWPSPIPNRTRVYVFNQHAWTPEGVKSIRSRLHRGM